MPQGKAVNITAENFEAEVLECQTKVLVDFWAAWCAPCRMLAPVIDQIAEETAGSVKVCKADIETAGPVAAEYGVMSIPALLFFDKGEEITRLSGVHTKEAILNVLGV
ncbi:MAG: thioredoxin [Oscillospiraceae bacterium]|nr:thioredoxin [Oscillospiraceae bacterium]